MAEVIIIGAGMAGLSAALELKQLGISYLLLEASKTPGGRGLSCVSPSGLVVDLGAHWLHGEKNPLKKLLEHYHIPYRRDKAEDLLIYRKGTVEKSHGDKWLKESVDDKKAQRIKKGLEPDCPISALAVDEKARQFLASFALMWDGIEPPLEPSALEFLTDESTPGGLQPQGGMKALITEMVEEVGHEHIKCNTPISAIVRGDKEIEVQAWDGAKWKANKVIFTPSPGVIESGLIDFEPGLGNNIQSYLSGLVMGKVNKIIIELDPDFFKQRPISDDMSVELLEIDPPHFCHIRSAGLPLIHLFVSGAQAQKIELLQGNEASHYVSQCLAPVAQMRGFQEYIRGEPWVSRWVGNPYTRGSYASCIPGAKRSDPLYENHICFCGDSFSEEFPASLAGAFLSGKKAAQKLGAMLR